MKLNTHRTSPDAAWLRDKFPVDLSAYRHLMVDNPTRQLDWIVRDPDTYAWTELSTGSLILIETIGGETSGAGFVTAQMWFAPADRLVELVPKRVYVDDSAEGISSHSTAAAAVAAAAEQRVPGFTRAM